MAAQQQYFGTAEQRAVTRRAANLWSLVSHDVRFGTHGRAVGLNACVTADLETQLSLATLQGVAPLDCIPDSDADEREAELRARGMMTDRYVHWSTDGASLGICRALVDGFTVPDGLELVRIDEKTPLTTLNDLSGLLASCEMMLPWEGVVRGRDLPSVYLMLKNSDGRPVAHASSTTSYHRNAPNGGEAHWGMLATCPERRGEGLAAWLGAMAMLEMNRSFGFEAFGTGIRAGNRPSEKLCSRLGLRPSGKSVLLAIDTEVLSGEQLTK